MFCLWFPTVQRLKSILHAVGLLGFENFWFTFTHFYPMVLVYSKLNCFSLYALLISPTPLSHLSSPRDRILPFCSGGQPRETAIIYINLGSLRPPKNSRKYPTCDTNIPVYISMKSTHSVLLCILVMNSPDIYCWVWNDEM